MPSRDNARVGGNAPRWSNDVHRAGWIAARLDYLTFAILDLTGM